MADRTYIAIDLKSFYASVECVERGLDPLNTNLVVADASRTEKTICLAVSPSLKAYGIPGRARLFEVVQKVKEANAQRRLKAPRRTLTEKSVIAAELKADTALELDYIIAPPQMAHYMEVSTQIYKTYLKYVAPEDIHVYSIDEVFIDATHYLDIYKLTPREMTMMLVRDVLESTGITATAGIGTNLYLAKIAMDIQAKHTEADEYGVRIAELDEMSYRHLLWAHTPLTDFWRVGRGYAAKLEAMGLYTMGDVARCSLHNEDRLYKQFGINAELLIDHAWGWEPCTIEEIKAYKPSTNSLSSGQVLQCPYSYDKAKLIVREMTELLILDLVKKHLVTDQIVLDVGYDIENLASANPAYNGETTTDRYGRKVPKYAHGTAHIKRQTSSAMLIMDAMMELFDRIVDKSLTVRRINVTACKLEDESTVKNDPHYEQLDLFTDFATEQKKQAQEEAELEREKRIQKAIIDLREKYGKNAILKGMNLEEGATTISRNKQIGGHKA